MDTLRDAAMAYARRGLYVLPLHAPSPTLDGGTGCTCQRDDCSGIGKHPRIHSGVEHSNSSIDPAEITDWWARWPDANVGIVTGRRSGLIVLDVDGDCGRLSLAALEAEFGDLPVSAAVKTARGWHLYYALPGAGARVGNRAAFCPGLDIRADGGLVVAPPSLHASGHRYAWAPWGSWRVQPGETVCPL